MRFGFDALAGLVTSHFGMNPVCGHIFVFFSRRRDRMKLLFWDSEGFVLYYKRLETGTFSWIDALDLNEGGEIEASDFAMILTGINQPRTKAQHKRKKPTAPHVPPLVLV
jgi:transposase